MRRAQLLINEARQSTNTQDQLEALPDTLLYQYLNRIQSCIQDMIMASGIKNKFNSFDYDFTTIIGQNEYDLPSNIYLENSVNNVFIVITDGPRQKLLPMSQISEKSLTREFGYVLKNSKIILPPFDFTNYFIRVSYVKKVPDCGARYGKIITVNPTSLVMDTGYGTNLPNYFDFFTVVDSNGEIIKDNMDLVSQSLSTINTSDTTGISAGQYIIGGNYSSSHSFLPLDCEKILLSGLEKMIMARLSSRDIEVSSVIDEDMLGKTILALSDNGADEFGPPILNNREWFF